MRDAKRSVNNSGFPQNVTAFRSRGVHGPPLNRHCSVRGRRGRFAVALVAQVWAKQGRRLFLIRNKYTGCHGKGVSQRGVILDPMEINLWIAIFFSINKLFYSYSFSFSHALALFDIAKAVNHPQLLHLWILLMIILFDFSIKIYTLQNIWQIHFTCF